MHARSDTIVSLDWLSRKIGGPEIALLDASYYLPNQKRDPNKEFVAHHIPTAVFFDINEIAEDNDLPHMLPDSKIFAAKVSALGISNTQHIIIYDTNNGSMAAMRAFWTFKQFGHQNVSILGGNLEKWIIKGLAVEEGWPTIVQSNYISERMNNRFVRTVAEVKRNCETGIEQLVDARSEGRYRGTEEEPRKGLRSGHIPGSLNLPFNNLVRASEHICDLQPSILEKRISAAGIDLTKPIISSCGSGVTAAVLYFALHIMGKDTVAIYDGSWAEWGSRDDTPITRVD